MGRARQGRSTALGNKPIATITVRQISTLLRDFDRTGVSTRTVNKKRQILSAIFNYAMREDTYALPRNPVTPTDKRREPPAAALDFFEPEEIETIAITIAGGGRVGGGRTGHGRGLASGRRDSEGQRRAHDTPGLVTA